jgi:hypothetical protein
MEIACEFDRYFLDELIPGKMIFIEGCHEFIIFFSVFFLCELFIAEYQSFISDVAGEHTILTVGTIP